MITQCWNPSPFTEAVDAISRVALFGTNAVGTPDIVHYGPVTKIPDGGITCGNGRLALLPFPAGGYSVAACLPDGSAVYQPTVNGQSIVQFLACANGTGDISNTCRYLSRKLNLCDRAPDRVEGYLRRCFTDIGYLDDTQTGSMIFRSPDGVLDCIEELLWVNGHATVMEVKFFKALDAGEVLKLWFTPRRSRIKEPAWCIPNTGTPVCITSELGIVLANQVDPLYWFQDCGDLDQVDFSCLRGNPATFLVTDFSAAPWRTRNSLAEALALKTAAHRKGIKISISTVELHNERPLMEVAGREYDSAHPELLTDEAFFQQCRTHGLKIDPVWLGNPYEVRYTPATTGTEPLLPFFFDRGRLAVFQEPAEKLVFRTALLPLLNGSNPFPDILNIARPVATLMFCRRGRIHRLRKQIGTPEYRRLHVYEDGMLLNAEADAMKELGSLLETVQPELVLLELSGYSEAQEKSLLSAIDLCLERGIAVGVFCEVGAACAELDTMSDKEFIVGREGAETYIIKTRFEDGSSVIQRFRFGDTPITIESASEKELRQLLQHPF